MATDKEYREQRHDDGRDGHGGIVHCPDDRTVTHAQAPGLATTVLQPERCTDPR